MSTSTEIGQLESSETERVESGGASWKNEQPRFDVERVQLQFELKNNLKRLLVANNFMYVLSIDTLYRIDLNNPSIPSKITLPNSSEGGSVTNCWLHPNGKFFILQINQTQYFHLHYAYTKFKLLPRFKGQLIEHFVFAEKESETSTGDFLTITRDGTVSVANIKYHEPGSQDKKRDDKYLKQVYKTSDTINGATFSNNSTQIELFVGDKIFVWDCFEPVLAELTRVFRQSPKAINIGVQNEQPLIVSARLKFYLVVPSTGELYTNDDEILMSGAESLDLNSLSLSSSPESFIVTEHHLIFLSDTRESLVIFNKLTPQSPIVKKISSNFLPSETVLGLSSDPVANTNWIFTTDGIYEIVIINESISIWYNYYKMGKYEEALQLLNDAESSNISLKKNVVLVKQGYELLQRGEFGLQPRGYEDELFKLQCDGIRQLAKLQEPFEKISLMLLNQQLSSFEISLMSSKLLIEYLKVKYSDAKTLESGKVRSIILSSWIIQLYLRCIQLVENQLAIESETQNMEKSNELESSNFNSQTIYHELNVSVDDFLRKNHKFLDAKTIYEFCNRMNFPDKIILLAETLGEFDFILQRYIEEENWILALKALTQLFTKDTERAFEAIQRTSTVLLMNFPQSTVETWLKFSDIDYEALLPAILAYNRSLGSMPPGKNPTVHFLLKLIYDRGIKSEVLNTCYLAILISYPSKESPPKYQDAILRALDFLRKDSRHIYSKNESPYDSDFLLRLCLRHKKYDPAILILLKDLQLFDTALNLALNKHLTSAAELILRLFDSYITETTEQVRDDETNENASEGRLNNSIKLEEESFAMRKKLWGIYAKYLIRGVCNGTSFDVLNNVDDQVPAKQSLKPNVNPVAELTQDLVSQMKEDLDVKTKSENLNKVLKYLLHFPGNCLSLEDLLRLFPEDVLIASFKDEIVDSLDFYNNRINQLSLEMQESAEIAEKLKVQLLESETQVKMGSLFSIIEAGEPCQICKNLLIDKTFVAFRNCHHCFHKDCMVRYYLQLKGDYRFKKIFQNFKTRPSTTDEKIVDSILLSVCILCNESNLTTVDEYLVAATRNKAELAEWSL